MKKFLLFLFVFVFVGMSFVALGISRVNAAWRIDQNGNLFETANVLGDSTENHSGPGEDEGSELSGRPDSIRVFPSGSARPQEIRRGSPLPIPSKKPESVEDSTEIGNDLMEMDDLNKDLDELETESQVDLFNAVGDKKGKVRLEQKDGKLVLKNEDGNELKDVGLNGEDGVLVDSRSGKDGFKIATGSGDQLVVVKNKVAAVSNFPLELDLNSHSLMISTPSGNKLVAVLPDEAVKRLKSEQRIDEVDSESVPVAGGVRSEASDGIVRLVDQNGKTGYEVVGVKRKKLLGLFDVSVEKMVTVSADDGSVLSESKDFVNSVKDMLSFSM